MLWKAKPFFTQHSQEWPKQPGNSPTNWICFGLPACWSPSPPPHPCAPFSLLLNWLAPSSHNSNVISVHRGDERMIRSWCGAFKTNMTLPLSTAFTSTHNPSSFCDIRSLLHPILAPEVSFQELDCAHTSCLCNMDLLEKETECEGMNSLWNPERGRK